MAKSKAKENHLAMGLFVVLTMAVLPLLNFDAIITRILIPVAVIFCVIAIKGGLKSVFEPPLIFLGLLIVWSIVPGLLAESIQSAITTFQRMLAVFGYAFVLSALMRHSQERALTIYKALCVSALIVFLQFFISPDIAGYQTNFERKFLFDPNTYGYFGFIGGSGLLLICATRVTNNYFLTFMFIFLVLSCVVSIVSASRGGFFISLAMLFGACYILIADRLRNRNIIQAMLGFLALAFIVIISVDFFNQSLLYSRLTQQTDAAIPRVAHAEEALRISLENPVFGIGGGNYANQLRIFEQGAFSHNGFLEAFVSFGIIGLMLYVASIAEYISRVIRMKKLREINSMQFNLHLLIITCFIAYNFLYVPYLTIEFIAVLVVARTNLRLLSKSQRAHDSS